MSLVKKVAPSQEHVIEMVLIKTVDAIEASSHLVGLDAEPLEVLSYVAHSGVGVESDNLFKG